MGLPVVEEIPIGIMPVQMDRLRGWEQVLRRMVSTESEGEKQVFRMKAAAAEPVIHSAQAEMPDIFHREILIRQVVMAGGREDRDAALRKKAEEAEEDLQSAALMAELFRAIQAEVIF